MKFNFFKRKKIKYKEYEGRFITDEEISEMIKPTKMSFIQSEFNEIQEMFNSIKTQFTNGQ